MTECSKIDGSLDDCSRSYSGSSNRRRRCGNVVDANDRSGDVDNGVGVGTGIADGRAGARAGKGALAAWARTTHRYGGVDEVGDVGCGTRVSMEGRWAHE